MTLRAIIVILIIGIGLSLQAQDGEKAYNDKVYFEDGSLIVGKVLEYIPGESVTLEMQHGNVMKFSAKQIRKVRMHEEAEEVMVKPFRSSRIYNETQFSFLSGESGTGLSLAHNVFWQHSSKFAYGGGIGIDNYYMASARDIFPVFANVKYFLLDNRSSLYIGGKVGYGMAFKNEGEDLFSAQGGLMMNPYFGMRIGSHGIMFNIFTGLKFQKASYEFIRPWETRQEEIYFRRIEIGTSVLF